MNDPTRPSGYDQHRDEVRALWDRGLSAPKISKQTYIPVYRVRILLEQSGVDLSNTVVHHRDGAEQHLPRLRELIEGGATIKEAAEKIGQKYTTVLRWVRAAGIETEPSDRQKHLPEVVRQYLAGDSCKGIAASLGVVPSTVSRWLHEEGYEPTTAPANRARRETKKDRLWPEVLRLHEQGLTTLEISRQVDAAQGTITIWLREEGLTPTYQRVEVSEGMSRADERQEEALRLYKEGTSITEAARVTGADRATVQRWVSKAGLAGQGGHVVRNRRDAEEAVRLYQSGLPMVEIARRMGKSTNQISGFLRDAGVKILTRWEREGAEALADFAEQGKTARLGHVNSDEHRQRQKDTLAAKREPVEPAAKPEKPIYQGHPCAYSECDEPIMNPDRKYHSDECQRLGAPRRQADPAKQTTTICAGCDMPFEHPRSQLRKYHDDECARTHTKSRPASETDGYVNGVWYQRTYEATFLSVVTFLKLGVRRYDRAIDGEAIYDDDRRYGPDYVVTALRGELAIEVKGEVREHNARQWAAYREQVGPLAVVEQARLLEVMASGSRTAAGALLQSWADEPRGL